MPKQKTHKGLAKRVKVTKKGNPLPPLFEMLHIAVLVVFDRPNPFLLREWLHHAVRSQGRRQDQ